MGDKNPGQQRKRKSPSDKIQVVNHTYRYIYMCMCMCVICIEIGLVYIRHSVGGEMHHSRNNEFLKYQLYDLMSTYYPNIHG